MNLKIKQYDGLPCRLSLFEINDIDSDQGDFVTLSDADPQEYHCGNMQALPIAIKEAVLEKYHISSEEFYSIQAELESTLSIGWCGWCE